MIRAIGKTAPMTPAERMARMRRTFTKDRSILAVDYEYFITQRDSTVQSIAERKSEERCERQSQGQSETRSSDKSDG